MVMMGMHSLPTNWPANFCQVPVRIAFRNPEVAAGLELGSFVDFFLGGKVFASTVNGQEFLSQTK